MIVINVVIGGFSGEDLKWLAHVTVRLQLTVRIHCLITTLQINSCQKTTVYAPIAFEEIAIVMINRLIVSIKKFSIMIGSPREYLSRNRRPITWVSNCRCPIWTFSNRTPVIGYPRDFNVNYVRFNGFLSNVFYSFLNLGKALRTFSLKRSSQQTFLIPKFVIDTIN